MDFYSASTHVAARQADLRRDADRARRGRAARAARRHSAEAGGRRRQAGMLRSIPVPFSWTARLVNRSAVG